MILSRQNLLFLFALTIVASVFIYRKNEIIRFLKYELGTPCHSTISYSIGSLSKEFGITNGELLMAIDKAENLWEDAYGKDLFTYKDNGEMKINLIYDYRQQATERLKSIGLDIKSDRATYDKLKSRYDSMLISYSSDKTRLQNDIRSLESRRTSYETEVAKWNNRGGAPNDEYDRLEIEKLAINREITRINNASESLNTTADTLNSLATVINQLITELHLNVAKYNNTTVGNDDEFDEGEYVIENGDMRIDIYQFDDMDKLHRVLAHELGHALNLNHVNDPEAIMYSINQSSNTKLTVADKDELKRVCGTLDKK